MGLKVGLHDAMCLMQCFFCSHGRSVCEFQIDAI